MAEEALLRRINERREVLKAFRSDFSNLTQEEMFDVAAEIATDFTVARESLEEIQSMEIPSGLTPNDADSWRTSKEELIDIATEEVQFHEKKYDDARREWRKKYGIGARSENARFDSEVESIRETRGLLSSSEAARNSRVRQLDEMGEQIKELDEKQAEEFLKGRDILLTEEVVKSSASCLKKFDL
jgi:hypothetical protein